VLFNVEFTYSFFQAKDAVGGGGFKLPNLGGGLPGSGTDSGVPKNS
jgi:hypothetical protein